MMTYSDVSVGTLHGRRNVIISMCCVEFVLVQPLGYVVREDGEICVPVLVYNSRNLVRVEGATLV